MRGPTLAVSCVALGLLCGAAPEASESTGRYQMMPAEGGGIIRLDRQTGAMSLCQRKGGTWVCEALADDRRALESEIDRLTAETSELKSAVKRLEELLGLPDADGRDRRAGGVSPKLKLPTEQDIDNAMSYVQRMLRKFKQKLRELEDDRDRRSL